MIQAEQGGTTGVAGVQTDGAYLRFSHSGIPDPLVISSGANSVKWVYTLNTNPQSTIGGEVIQILGAYAGPLVVEGMATSVDELVAIKEFFVQVFERMGNVYRSGGNNAQFRDETAVLFEYPARGWQFQIMPTKLRGFKYDQSNFAPPWQVEAEIITDNALDFLNAATFSAFTGPLMNPKFYDTGYSDPTGTGRASRFVNPALSGDLAGLGATMGDNFQRLVVQGLAGGFGNFAYNAVLPYGHPNKTVTDEYNALFGTPGVQTAAGSSGSGSGSSNAASGTTGDLSGLSQNRLDYANGVASGTGLDPRVVLTWMTGEGNPGDLPGYFNYMNIATSTAISLGFKPVGSGPANTAQLGSMQVGIACAVAEIQSPAINILPAATPRGEIANIAASPWASSHYGGPGGPNLVSVYNSLFPGTIDQPCSPAQLSSGTSSAPTGSGGVTQYYKNPLRSIANLFHRRIDQGVDYGGTGPVYAIGNGKVLAASTTAGWPGGGFVSYLLTDGPAKGLAVYIAESVTPTVSVGDTVTSNTVICQLNGLVYPWCETGWADVSGATQAAAWQIGGSTQTVYGVNFSQLLVKLGAPAGIDDGSAVRGTLPTGWPVWN